MICYLKGKILQKHLDFIILDVNGVGYEVLMPANMCSALPHENDTTELYILTYVREDAFRLYGFSSMFNKQIFESLLDVSGIGPKAALAILGTMDGHALCDVVLSHQPQILTKIPGIGSKTAERLVLELKSKCQKLLSKAAEQNLFSPQKESLNGNNTRQIIETKQVLDDLKSALGNMGYKEKQFSKILESFHKRLKYGEVLKFEDMLKETLKKLSEHILKG